MEMNSFDYYGVFLDNHTSNMLMDKLTDNPEYNKLLGKADKIFIDHCTLLHKSQHNRLLYSLLEAYEGYTIEMKLVEVGYSDKAMAFKVAWIKNICSNKIPHITIATFNGGKPVDSNNITEWESI